MVRDHDKEQHHLGHVFIGLLMYCKKTEPQKENASGEGGESNAKKIKRYQWIMSSVGRWLTDTGVKRNFRLL